MATTSGTHFYPFAELIAYYPPTRYERFKAWLRGESAKGMAVYQIW